MKKVIGAVSLSFMPFVAFAAITDIKGVINVFGDLINALTPLLLAVATIWLIWNLVKYIEAGKGDEKTRGEARDSIILALILLFVMVSIWGLVRIISGTFQLETSRPESPKLFESK